MDQPADAPAESTDPAPTDWPSVSDYWPDDPRGQQSGAKDDAPAAQPDDDGITWIGADGSPGSPGRSRGRRSLFVLGCVLAAAFLVVTGAVMATLIKQAHQEPSNSAAAVPSPEPAGNAEDPSAAEVEPAPSSSVATGAASVAPAPTATTPSPPNLPATATFELAGVAPAVTLHTRDLGTDLYSVTVAESAAAEAQISNTGTVYRLALTHNGKAAQAPVDIALNAGVRWTVRLTGGTTKDVLNFGDSHLAAVELAAGATRIDLTLPPASGTLPVRVTKGISELHVRTAQEDPIRLDLRAGAGQVQLDGETRNGIARGVVLRSEGWGDADDRADLQATAGVGTLSVKIGGAS